MMTGLFLHKGGVIVPRGEYDAETEILSGLIQAANEILGRRIDRLNEIDGDPDLETEALEDDGTPAPEGIDFGPGCEISDPSEQDDHGGCEHDGREPEEESLFIPQYRIDQTKPPKGGWHNQR